MEFFYPQMDKIGVVLFILILSLAVRYIWAAYKSVIGGASKPKIVMLDPKLLVSPSGEDAISSEYLPLSDRPTESGLERSKI